MLNIVILGVGKFMDKQIDEGQGNEGPTPRSYANVVVRLMLGVLSVSLMAVAVFVVAANYRGNGQRDVGGHVDSSEDLIIVKETEEELLNREKILEKARELDRIVAAEQEARRKTEEEQAETKKAREEAAKKMAERQKARLENEQERAADQVNARRVAWDEVERQKIAQYNAKQSERARRAWLKSIKNFDDSIGIGKIGRIRGEVEVLQVIDEANFLATIPLSSYSLTVWFKGIDTDNKVDGQRGHYSNVFEVTGKAEYPTVLGSSSTVFVLELLDEPDF